ncbi:MAG: GNAT family N-acetyltransferase [Lachnospiraceae bacterium]|nr:GNAT family N-acetyltransferase [Lachnospiraceae bacterium]
MGMVAYHRHSDERCEMKRLYVKPETRGMHLGDAPVEAIIDHARTAGYKSEFLGLIEWTM